MTDEKKLDPTKVRGIRVLVACDSCDERGWVRGGPYAAQGEVIRCPRCNGNRMVAQTITLSALCDLLEKEG